LDQSKPAFIPGKPLWNAGLTALPERADDEKPESFEAIKAGGNGKFPKPRPRLREKTRGARGTAGAMEPLSP
jgi:hypothetical protein